MARERHKNRMFRFRRGLLRRAIADGTATKEQKEAFFLSLFIFQYCGKSTHKDVLAWARLCRELLEVGELEEGELFVRVRLGVLWAEAEGFAVNVSRAELQKFFLSR